MRVGGGKNARLSIPRDTIVDIPGHGRDKINAAYAFGGAALAVQTIEQYLGIQVNHLIEVNFNNFPQLIDAMGGITYKGGCVVSKINGGFKNGGFTLRLKQRQDPHQRQAGARARPHPQERLQPGRVRPHPRAAPAEDPVGDEGAADLAVRVPAAAVDRLEHAQGAAQRHGRPDPARPLRRAGDQRLAADRRSSSPTACRPLPTAAPASTSPTRRRPRDVARFLKG